MRTVIFAFILLCTSITTYSMSDEHHITKRPVSWAGYCKQFKNVESLIKQLIVKQDLLKLEDNDKNNFLMGLIYHALRQNECKILLLCKERLKDLLKHGININHQNKRDYTALMLLAEHNYGRVPHNYSFKEDGLFNIKLYINREVKAAALELFTEMLRLNADITLQDVHGRIALLHTMVGYNEAMTHLLLNRAPQLACTRDNRNYTVAEYAACYRASPQMFATILDVMDKQGQPPLLCNVLLADNSLDNKHYFYQMLYRGIKPIERDLEIVKTKFDKKYQTLFQALFSFYQNYDDVDKINALSRSVDANLFPDLFSHLLLHINHKKFITQQHLPLFIRALARGYRSRHAKYAGDNKNGVTQYDDGIYCGEAKLHTKNLKQTMPHYEPHLMYLAIEYCCEHQLTNTLDTLLDQYEPTENLKKWYDNRTQPEEKMAHLYVAMEKRQDAFAKAFVAKFNTKIFKTSQITIIETIN